MHPDADAFLDAIDAHFWDDTPRLVYADWLEEYGQPEYAQFIRLQCEAARHPYWSSEANRLWEEIGQTWARLTDEWRYLLAGFPLLDACHFRRGFLARPLGRGDTSELLVFAYYSWAWHPAGVFDQLEIGLEGFEDDYGPDAADDLWERGRFDQLRELTVSDGRVPPELFDRPLTRLRVLDLSHARVGARLADRLVRSTGMPNLRRLVVGRESGFARETSQMLWSRFGAIIQFGWD